MSERPNGAGTLEPSANDSADEVLTRRDDVDVTAIVSGQDSPGLETSIELLGGGSSRYELLSPLGSGGMGIVYEARDRVLDRKVALKVLRGEHRTADRHDAARARMLREAQALAKLNHPNVVTVHDAGLLPSGELCLAMELVQGQTLREWQDSGRGWRAILDAYIAAGQGLHAAHEHDIVHRDFKPDNVLVREDAAVLVTDFGLARSTHEPQQTVSSDRRDGDAPALEGITEHGAVVGTPAYMAPEQHCGDTVGPATDQFAFCVSLYEGLYGQRPFVGKSMEELARAVIGGKVQPPPDRRGNPPRRVWRAIARGLSTSPRDRFGSMHALVSELQRVRSSRPRRTAVIAAGVLVGGGGLAASALLLIEQPCAGLDQPLLQVWNPQVRTTRRDAFTDASAHGDETWLQVQAGIDAWAHAWTAARTDACRATRVRGEQSEQLLDVRMRCLDDALGTLRAYLDATQDADTTVVDNAIASLSVLAPVQRCGDVELLARTVPWPDDPKTAEAVRAVRDQLKRVETTVAAGHYADALAPAEDAARKAEGTGYEPVMAEAEIELGRLLVTHGRHDRAKAYLDRAMSRALASGHDDVLADAAVSKLALLGPQPDRDDEARLLVQQADAALRRIGDPPQKRAWWLHFQAQRAKEQARWEEAGAFLRRLQAISDEHEDMLRWKSIALNELGDLARRRGEPEKAIPLLERALQARIDYVGSRHADVSRDLNNLALALEAVGRTDEALERFDEALELLVAGYGEDHPDVGRIHNNLGMTLSAVASGDPKRLEQAAEHLERALQLKRDRFGDGAAELGSTLANLAVVDQRRGNLEEALQRFEQVDQIFREHLGPTHPAVVRVGNSIVDLRLARGEADQARAHLETYREAIEPPDADIDARITFAAHEVRILLIEQRADEALQVVQRLKADLQARGESPPAIVTALEGETLLATGDASQARALLTSAVEGMNAEDYEAIERLRAHLALAQALAPTDPKRCNHLEIARTLLRNETIATRTEREAATTPERCPP